MAWFNGLNVDVRPDPDPNFDDGIANGNAYFSDEDEFKDDPRGDRAYQDYDPERMLSRCLPEFHDTATAPAHPTDFAVLAGFFAVEGTSSKEETYRSDSNYAVVVEKGDCDPRTGVDFRYRGHLDFVDPNSIYHEVQEFDYVCGDLLQPGGPAGNHLPGGQPSVLLADTAKERFPLTYTAAGDVDGCAEYEQPVPNGSYDWGHKCNGSIQDLFTERLWITPLHDIIVDPSINSEYNFALAVDTCSGLNVREHRFFGGSEPHDIDATDYFLDNLGIGQPLAGVCHDGSSFSFDDTQRGRIHHSGPPHSIEDMMSGNAFESDQWGTSFAMHRQNCRSNYLDWAYNEYPGRNVAASGPLGAFEEAGIGGSLRFYIGEDCYPEDHKWGMIDVYTFDIDPTGLFAIHTNGLTGLNAYVVEPATGPNWDP